MHSEESPQCLFRDYDDNKYLTYEISYWDKGGKEFFNKVLRKLSDITEVYVEDYLADRLCNINISYPKSWEDNKPELWKKVYAE